MKYLSVAETAKSWGVSERSVRNYCAENRVVGAVCAGKSWSIPEGAVKPERTNGRVCGGLLDVLTAEKTGGISGGIYHKVQIEMTYNSNHIEGSRLTHDQTRYIFETNTIGITDAVNVDDIIETSNHFRCIDLCIEQAKKPLSAAFIKQLHCVLKTGTSDANRSWFNVGEYKKLPNEVGGKQTSLPENVASDMGALLEGYNRLKKVGLEEIVEFHARFEAIHPFQDGNGRVGRLIMFKECLKNGIVPFTIDERHKMFYYRGLSEWDNERGFLIETCRSAQDVFANYLDYFRIPYKK